MAKSKHILFVLFVLNTIVIAQIASDYYPMHVGDYWIQHTDSISGEYQPTTFRKDIEAIDLILGEEYFRLSQAMTADDGSSESTWYSWIREDSAGMLLGGFGVTSFVDSVTIFYPPLLWLPNEIVNVGHAWEFNAPEMGGHFFFAIGSITDTVEIPAGTFFDCIRIYGLIVDTSGDSTQMNLFHHAEGIGEVSNILYNVSLGYFKLELIEYYVQLSVDDNTATGVPIHFSLRQNYPNPFNPVTTIQYELPQRSDVQITIFDLLGRKVTTLVSETQDAGYKSVLWDATNDQGQPVSAGVYFYQVKAGDFVQTRKMVVLK